MDLVAARAKLTKVKADIIKCQTAKTAISNVQSTCESQVSSWENSFKKLSGNAELKKVKKKDVFEGEMADSLARRVSNIVKEINDAISKSKKLSKALSSQEKKLTNKITKLQSEKTSLENTIRTLEAQEAAAKKAAAAAAAKT